MKHNLINLNNKPTCCNKTCCRKMNGNNMNRTKRGFQGTVAADRARNKFMVGLPETQKPSRESQTNIVNASCGANMRLIMRMQWSINVSMSSLFCNLFEFSTTVHKSEIKGIQQPHLLLHIGLHMYCLPSPSPPPPLSSSPLVAAGAILSATTTTDARCSNTR